MNPEKRETDVIESCPLCSGVLVECLPEINSERKAVIVQCISGHTMRAFSKDNAPFIVVCRDKTHFLNDKTIERKRSLLNDLIAATVHSRAHRMPARKNNPFPGHKKRGR